MGENILALDLVPAERLRLVPLGVAPEFFDFEKARPNSNPILEKLHHGTFVLHVGSCIRRKRIDVLLKVFKQLRADIANLRLVKVGDSWTTEQERMIDELEIAPYIDHLGKLTRTELAFVYQHASATLVPSSAEGFGLPVIEALACGGPVVASDLPTLREAGGEWANYATTADTAVWTKAVYQAISANTTTELRRQRRRWAQKFSWSEHARRIAQEYSNFSKYTSGSPSRLRGHLNGT